MTVLRLSWQDFAVLKVEEKKEEMKHKRGKGSKSRGVYDSAAEGDRKIAIFNSTRKKKVCVARVSPFTNNFTRQWRLLWTRKTEGK